MRASVLPPFEPGLIYCRQSAYPDFTYINRDADRQAIDRDGLVAVGDVGYFDRDGYLYICDRKSDMVISGGVNIYPAEIEAVLITMPEVADCAVFGIPDAEFGEALAAHVQPHDGAAIEREAVRAFLKERIADYKVPRVIEFSDALPREEFGQDLQAAAARAVLARGGTEDLARRPMIDPPAPCPPFRAEHVGSLLRPAALLDLRRRFARGEIDQATLTAAEDRAIEDAVRVAGARRLAARDRRRIPRASRITAISTASSATFRSKRRRTEPRTAARRAADGLDQAAASPGGRPIHAADFAFLRAADQGTAEDHDSRPLRAALSRRRCGRTAHAYRDVDSSGTISWRRSGVNCVRWRGRLHLCADRRDRIRQVRRSRGAARRCGARR